MNLACVFLSLCVLIWRAHYIHIMMGSLYDIFFHITLTYLFYAKIITHSHSISVHHDCSKIRIIHYVVFCNVTVVFNNTLYLRVRILAIQSFIPM